jgi:hypothetical protein
MLAASLSRFHCGLGHPTCLILNLFEENDAITGIGNSALRISSEYPGSYHTITPAIIYLDSHIRQLQFIWDLLTLMVVVIVFLIV